MDTSTHPAPFDAAKMADEVVTALGKTATPATATKAFAQALAQAYEQGRKAGQEKAPATKVLKLDTKDRMGNEFRVTRHGGGRLTVRGHRTGVTYSLSNFADEPLKLADDASNAKDAAELAKVWKKHTRMNATPA